MTRETTVEWREIDRFEAIGDDGSRYTVVEFASLVTFRDDHRAGKSATVAGPNRLATSPDGLPVTRTSEGLVIESSGLSLWRR